MFTHRAETRLFQIRTLGGGARWRRERCSQEKWRGKRVGGEIGLEGGGAAAAEDARLNQRLKRADSLAAAWAGSEGGRESG